MFDLEAEYVEGLKLIAFWHGCEIKDVIKLVAEQRPVDLGLAVRGFVFDWFVNKRFRGVKPHQRGNYWYKKWYAAPMPTRHFIRYPEMIKHGR